MRKLALLTTAMLGLACSAPSFAQPNQAGPQPGLPPGAGIGAPNALQPRPSGEIRTTPTGPMAAPVDTSVPPPAPVYRHRRRHHYVRHHHYVRRHHHVAPAAAPVTNQ